MADRPRQFEVPITTEVVVQADIGGMSIAFTRVAIEGEIDVWLDTCRRAVNRQKAQAELVEALVDIEARREAMASWPQRERDRVKARAEERTRLVASFQAAHQVGRPRVDFQMTPAQRKGVIDFDTESERKALEEVAARERVEAEIPHYEARAARARAIIGGKERSEVIGGEGLREAAD